MKLLIILSIFITFCFIPCHADFGLTTIAVGSILSSSIAYYGKTNYEYCNSPSNWNLNHWINYDPNFNNLKDEIVGQDVALNVVPKLIKQHLKNTSPDKALVLSFHGFTGTGKNLLSSLIAKQIYSEYNKTGKSKFVHLFTSTFFQGENEDFSKRKLISFIETNIVNCDRSLFIIDEVDKFPPKFLDMLVPFFDSHNSKYNKAIFLLLR